MDETLVILFVALIIDRLIGDPDWLWQRVSHPVVLFGKAIGWADVRFNDASLSDTDREKRGGIMIAALIIGAIVVGLILSEIIDHLAIIGPILEIMIVAVFLAQKSLVDHVSAVAHGLRAGGLDGGRRAVAMIVGRDPEKLDSHGVCRASIESLAENTSDGVVAPAFWYALFGLPGLFAYKMLNTADSMIGHKTDKHRAFGKAAARLDDLANWVPARLTALLILPAGGLSAIGERLSIVFSDAKLHRSPNAGWPESAMAAVTGLALGGPRIYHADIANEPFMNEAGRAGANADDIDGAIGVFWRSMTLLTVAVGILALVTD